MLLGVLWILVWVAPDWVRAAGSSLAARAAAAYYERSYWQLSSKELAQCGEYFVESLQLYLPELLAFAAGGALWLKAVARARRCGR